MSELGPYRPVRNGCGGQPQTRHAAAVGEGVEGDSGRVGRVSLEEDRAMKKLTGACIIVSLMTISVSEALADCAWVAWTKNRLINTSEGRMHDEVTWEVHSAFEKRAQCVDMRERLWNEAVKDAESTPHFKNLKKQFPDKLSAEVPDGSWEKAFYCLPERIDPRKKLPI